jgi:glycosyltransferase involved in cell wall biosynthesis
MRILHLIDSLDPQRGGPVEGLRLIGAELRAMGHTAEVASTDRPDADYLSDFPLPVHALGQAEGTFRYSPLFSRWVHSHAGSFDAAVIHGLWTHAATSGRSGLLRSGVPYVVYAHGMMDRWFRQTAPLKHWKKQVFWWLRQGSVLKDAAAVLFTSDDECRSSRSVFIGARYRERVVAYGSSRPPEADLGSQHAFTRSMPSLDAHPYFLFLGRLHPKKGCDLLVDAFAQFAGTNAKWHLVMAGPDQVSDASRLRARAGEVGHRIHWPGMLTGPAKWAALRGAGALVLPSHQENFGIVVAEAMACGVPVLISDKVNIWRDVEAAGAGLVAPDTLTGTLGLLRRFARMSEGERRSMGKSAERTWEDRFTVRRAATDLENTLQHALAGACT